MIIEIPQGYVFSKEDDIIAFEENGKLKIRPWRTRIDYVMYDLTYHLKGKSRCYYCGKTVEYPSKVTLDHMYPKALGGPTIPQNLVPACRECNGTKDNMTPDQFRAYLSLGDSAIRKEFKREFFNIKYFQERWLHILPLGWTEKIPISELIMLKKLHDTTTWKYAKTKEYYERTGQFRKPIVVDCNKVVFDGSTEVFFAQNNKIQEIPAIVLENVEVIFDSEPRDET